MAIKLNSGMNNGMTAKMILASKGKILSSGFMDEIDREAESAANAISRRNSLTPRKIGRRAVGFGRPQNHPNAMPQNFAMLGN